MNRKPKTSALLIQTIIAIVIAIYVLFPFYMVVVNSMKTTTGIVNDPLTPAGADFGTFISNLSGVINNDYFLFWKAFACSVVITVISVLLLNLFGAMAGWVISRNQKKKWASAIYFTFIASMIIKKCFLHMHSRVFNVRKNTFECLISSFCTRRLFRMCSITVPSISLELRNSTGCLSFIASSAIEHRRFVFPLPALPVKTI